MKYFGDDEKNQVCSGILKKQKLNVFNLAEKLGTEYLEFQVDFGKRHGFNPDPSLANDGVLKFLLTYKLKQNITPQTTGIPAVILWWIASYIINYVVEKLMERYFNEQTRI